LDCETAFELRERRLADTTSKQSEASGVGASPIRPRIGVLAIQGNFAMHAEALIEAGADPIEVRNPSELDGLDGLILPGGESTTMLKFLERRNFFDTLKEFAATQPVFGTCAGAILLAKEVRHPQQRSLGALDMVVERNAYGRQIDSSILTAPSELPGEPLEMVFIRAPQIVETGKDVEVLARRRAGSWRPRFTPSSRTTGACIACSSRRYGASSRPQPDRRFPSRRNLLLLNRASHVMLLASKQG
jgi:pyridoxal 5'-phosphate synthase pdxT subunit